MTQAFITSMIVSLIFGIIVTIIAVFKALKDPEKFQKMSDDTYKKFSGAKSSVSKNMISWEEAKKIAAQQLDSEKKDKENRKK